MTGPQRRARVTSDGMVQEITGDRARSAGARLDADAEAAAGTGQHVWIVAVAHRITQEKAGRVMSGGEQLILDAESAVVTGIGCYVCEEPFGPLVAFRRCPGEPK